MEQVRRSRVTPRTARERRPWARGELAGRHPSGLAAPGPGVSVWAASAGGSLSLSASGYKTCCFWRQSSGSQAHHTAHQAVELLCVPVGRTVPQPRKSSLFLRPHLYPAVLFYDPPRPRKSSNSSRSLLGASHLAPAPSPAFDEEPPSSAPATHSYPLSSPATESNF